MLNSWWQSFRALLDSKVRERARRKHRPLVESLEDRRLMARVVWDGGGVANDQWSNRFNWEGNVAPVFDDELVFPAGIGALDRGMNNDFTTGTRFNKITFEGENYTLRGNRITIGPGGIESQIGGIDQRNRILLDVTLSPGENLIRVAENALFEIRNVISGTGNLVKVGKGLLFLSGKDSNTFTGKTILNEGEINTFKEDAVAIPGTLEIHGGGFSHTTVLGEDIDGEDIGDDADVFVFGGAFGFGSLAVQETIGSLTVTGGVINAPPSKTLIIKRKLEIGSDKSLDLKCNLLLQGPTNIPIGVNSELTLSGKVSGSNLTKSGTGKLILNPQAGGNTYGATTVTAGILQLQSPASGRAVIPRNLTIGGTAATARVVINGGSELIANNANVSVQQNGTLTLGTSVETIGNLTLGSLVNAGPFTVNLSLSTLIVSSTLTLAGGATLSQDQSFVDVRGAALNLGGAWSILNNSVSVVQGQTQMINGSVTLGSSGLIEFLNGLNMTGSQINTDSTATKTKLKGTLATKASSASSVLQGTLELSQGSHEVSVADGAANRDLIINALIQNAAGTTAGITKTGPGILELAGNNTYTGATNINGGTVLVQGVNSANQSTYFVNQGRIAGSGTISGLRIGGTSDASISPSNGGTAFKVLGTTTFGASSRYIAELNGAAQGQFDRVATQTAFLDHIFNPEGRPVLDPRLAANFTPTVGTNFRIVDITGPNPVGADQFFQLLDGNVLTQGETFQINGLNFTISYSGGTGNDIVLTRNTGAAFANRKITPVITEGQTAFITGHITEPNHGDTFVLDVDWGDGVKQTFTFPPGSPKDIKVGHRYLDDPAGTEDRYQVKLRWRDQHGGGNSAALETVVRNKAPVLGEITASLPPLNVGEPITIRGTIQDVPRDSFKLHVRWDLNGPWQAINLPAGTKTFQLKHTYARSGDHHVTILVIDDDLDFDQVSFLLNVS